MSSNEIIKPKVKSKLSAKQCYCGKGRNMNLVELLCANCDHWFHESCISYQLGKLVPFMTNYIFMCKNCSATGLETFKKSQASITQICVTAIANMMQAAKKEGKKKILFSKDKDIIPFISSHWEGMNVAGRKLSQSWQSTVLRVLARDANSIFKTIMDKDDTFYGLMEGDIARIKPNYEAMAKSGQLKVTTAGIQPAGTIAAKGRGTKRKGSAVVDSRAVENKRQKGSKGGADQSEKDDSVGGMVLGVLSPHGYPLEHPYNKDGFKYYLAESDPHSPCRQEFDESLDTAGKRIPGWLYRKLCPNAVLLALHDKAPQLTVSDDRLCVTGFKGYRMIRATHYVNRGTWYFEVHVNEMPGNSAARIGWALPYANLQTPCGFDKYAYSWRSRKGSKFHDARGKHYSEGYSSGDTLGLLITLPDANKSPSAFIPESIKDRPLVKFKSHLYFEDKDNIAEVNKNLRPLPGSRILCFKNGVCIGVAFSDIYAGSYHPAVSLYKSAKVSLNFGPNFRFPPSKKEFKYRCMSERVDELICEETIADLAYFLEFGNQLKVDA